MRRCQNSAISKGDEGGSRGTRSCEETLPLPLRRRGAGGGVLMDAVNGARARVCMHIAHAGE